MMQSIRTIACWSGSVAVAAATLTLAPPASAQTAPAGPVSPAAAPGADQNLWVGRLGLGWYGTRNVPLGNDQTVATPVVGVRYWLSPTLGIDGALGFYMQSGSNEAAGVSQDTPSQTAFLLHAGLPLALLNMSHYSFQITPEIDFGTTSGTTKNAGAADTSRSGTLIQVGARAGAEVFFGFMGLPQLSLDASVGLFLSSRSGKTSAAGGDIKSSQLVIGTSEIHNPWDVFRENIAARYYF